VSFDQVRRALDSGADPDMLCMTCPWDRFCVTPPTMTRSEIDTQIEEAQQRDNAARRSAEAAGDKPGLPAQTLLAAVTLGGRDTAAPVCPVLAMRLRLPEGRAIVDLVKGHMQRRDGASS
jgi:hypothetical protein